MANLNGHEAGNGGYSQGEPTDTAPVLDPTDEEGRETREDTDLKGRKRWGAAGPVHDRARLSLYCRRLAGFGCPPRPGERTGRVFRTRSIRTAFENAVEEAKLDDFHFHDTRHHFASWFVMRGGNVQELREILGHATLAMTMRYAHLSPAHLRSAMLRTESRAESARKIAQEIAQEAVGLGVGAAK